jgi:salicylate hydroxylase
LYERDAAADARRKGYAIGLKGDAGFSVLERLGLLDDVLSIGAEQVTNFVITDRQGRTLLALPSGNDARRRTYRVQRDHLQSVLADTLTTTPVHFGFEAVGYETIDTRHRVVFTGGRHVDGDVVVGCDGVGSVLRRQIVDDSPHFLGLSAITGDAALTVDDRLLSGGYFMTLGDRGDSFFCYRQPGGVHFSYTSATEPAAFESTSQPDLLRRVREATADWHPLIGAIVSAADPDSIKRRGYYDRNPTNQVRDGNVWLMGDAAHPMSPFQAKAPTPRCSMRWSFPSCSDPGISPPMRSTWRLASQRAGVRRPSSPGVPRASSIAQDVFRSGAVTSASGWPTP